MPPAISDDEMESDGPDAVPAKIVPVMQADEEEEEEEEEEESEDGEEYRVEQILKHGYAKGGAVIYQVKWLGYDEESDLTWEPVENLENAPEILNSYHDSIGGAPEPKGKGKKGPKPNKRSASTAFESPAVEASGKKRGRKSAGDANGTTPKDKKLPEGSWEELVVRVGSIVEETDIPKGAKGITSKNLHGLLEWNDGRKTQHPMTTLRRKCPQRLLDYYEQHLVFKSGGDDTDS